MSTPRPSEADVEAWGPLSADERAAIYAQITERAEAFLVQCGACDGGLPMSCVCNDGDPRPVIADLLNMFAARDAEHEREVAALAFKFEHAHKGANIYRERAEAAERDRDEWARKAEQRLRAEVEARRALADLRGEIKALADEWETEAGEDSEAWRIYGPQSVSVPFAVASLRALLPRDDAAGAGGAE